MVRRVEERIAVQVVLDRAQPVVTGEPPSGLHPQRGLRRPLRLPAPLALDELHLLWRREMVIGAYRPRWMRVRTAGRDLIALSFVVDRSNLHYARGLSIERKAQVLACAAGAMSHPCRQ